MNTNYTYAQIANSYDLWLELVDTDGNMDRETFDATPVEALVVMMTDMFGIEDEAPVTTIEFWNGSRARIINNAFIDELPYGVTDSERDGIIESVNNGQIGSIDWCAIR